MTTPNDTKNENLELKSPATGISKFIRKVNPDSILIQAEATTVAVVALKESESVKLQQAFLEVYPTIRISNTEGEVYCSRLLPFGDVVFREGYGIKFRLHIRDGLALMTILNTLDFDKLHYKYIRQFHGNHVQPRKLLFIPEEANDIEKLIADYIAITENIIARSSITIGNRGVRQ